MPRRLEVILRGLCTFATIVFFTACPGQQTDTDTASKITQPDPACAQLTGMSSAPASRTDSMHRVSELALRFIIANNWCKTAVPEYQDAQRFIAQGKYGPLAQSAASPDLGNLTSHTAFDGGFVNVAMIDVAVNDGALTQPYLRLHLQIGLNCVYLMHEHTGSSERWRGKIAPPSGNDCNTAGPAPVMPVVAEDEGESIPPVTRFVQDKDRMPFIGVRCGTASCIIGAPAAADVPAPAHAGTAGGPPPPYSRVKGWFDDQHLAILGTSGGLEPSDVRASVAPESDLVTKKVVDFQAGFVYVARAFFPLQTPVPQKYVSFGFSAGWNRIELQLTSAGVWQARITNATGNQVLRKATRVAHTWLNSPGTARWAWTETDEWIWVACDDGCCLIEPTTA